MLERALAVLAMSVVASTAGVVAAAPASAYESHYSSTGPSFTVATLTGGLTCRNTAVVVRNSDGTVRGYARTNCSGGSGASVIAAYGDLSRSNIYVKTTSKGCPGPGLYACTTPRTGAVTNPSGSQRFCLTASSVVNAQVLLSSRGDHSHCVSI